MSTELLRRTPSSLLSYYFFADPATTEIHTLSLHDALPICQRRARPAVDRPAVPPALTRTRPCRPACSCCPAPISPGWCTRDRKSTRLNSSHMSITYAVFCLKKKTNNSNIIHDHTTSCSCTT